MKSFTTTDIRPFMVGLLNDKLFSGWHMREAELNLMTHIEIDGRINQDYLTDEEKQQLPDPFITWDEIQPRIKGLIQGGHTPTMMNIVLAMNPARVKDMPAESVGSLQLNIRYETVPSESGPRTQRLTLVTATSMKTFSLDKTPERIWDDAVPKYFKAHGIALQEN